ncbi:MAG TPA: preprotein translocase subunit SecE [Gemmatimonadales bacterium]|nr:preprotein translocase subunit SecE [Gemmatimonadales bacterium]
MSGDVTTTESANGVTRFGGSVVEFLRAVRLELGKVTWPSKDELLKATRMIVVLSVILGLAIGWMDSLLNLVLVTGVAAMVR